VLTFSCQGSQMRRTESESPARASRFAPSTPRLERASASIRHFHRARLR
jgi:hypothetical protein